MDELQNIRHIREGNISMLSWIKDLLRTRAVARFDITDIRGTTAYYMPRLKALTKRLVTIRK